VKALPKVFMLISILLIPIALVWTLLFDRATLRHVTTLATRPDEWAGRALMVIALVGCGVFLLLVAYSVAMGLLTKVVSLFSRFLSWLTGYPSLLSRAKIASWLFFVLGFWLDFLAS